MYEHSLDGKWQLTFVPEGRQAVQKPADLSLVDVQTIDAVVPGNVELDLECAGLLPDPFVGSNVLEVAKYEDHEWWYRRAFATPKDAGGRRAVLRFEGLDCFATVWVNDQVVGKSANMLIPHEMDVTAALRPEGEENQLVVRLGSAVREAARMRYDANVQALPANFESLRVRKAAHMYGWDIAPRIVSAGIWRSVTLQLHEPLEIGGLYYYTRECREGQAALSVSWQLRMNDDAAGWRGCDLRFVGVCGDRRLEHLVPCRFAAGSTSIAIDQPRPWWPKGYGEPALYEVTCQLVRNGQVLDERTDRVGIRTIELVRTDTTTREKPGEFLFRVNGIPIMCKGSNWVPADALHSRDAERVPRILELFGDLGCNMLRCWGGNVYEDEPFYDFCDAHGIMVWQDFSMACGRYPQDDEFLAAMREEAECIVRKLRNHSCIALWAGDNECDESWLGWGAVGQNPNHNRITREVLPQVVLRCDPARPYLPSSPYIAPAIAEAADRSIMPEQHLWGPRDYFKSSFYTQATAHFVSEIGYHGCPCVDSLERFLSPDKLWPWRDNEEWRLHAADTWPEPGPYAYRIELMAKQIHEMFGIEPDHLEDFVLASQICQAEAKKFFVEMTRLKKWRMTGVLWWNVMDCWPQFSDAIVDYYFHRKLAYLYIRRVQQPACIMMTEPDSWASRVMLGNDSRDPVRGTFTIRDADTDEVLLNGPAEASPNENRDLGSLRVSRGSQRLFLIEWTLNGEEGRSHYLAGTPPFDLERYKTWLVKLLPCDVSTVVRRGLPS